MARWWSKGNTCTAVQNVNWCICYGKYMELLQKITNKLAYDPAVPLLSMNTRKTKNTILKKIHGFQCS